MKPLLRPLKHLVLCAFLALGNLSAATTTAPSAQTNSRFLAAPTDSLHTTPGIKKGTWIKQVLYALSPKPIKAKKPSVSLAIIATFLIAIVLTAVFWGLSYGGASAGAYIIVGILGAALLFFGITRIIRAIKRKRAMALPGRDKP